MSSDARNTSRGVAALVRERLTRIKAADGFETDMGSTVLQGRTKVEDADVPPGGCVSIIEGLDSVDDRPGKIPSVLIDQRFGIVAYMPCQLNEPNVAAHRAIRDIKLALFAGKAVELTPAERMHTRADFDGQVVQVRYLGKDIGPRADGVAIVMAVVEISVIYVEDLTAP